MKKYIAIVLVLAAITGLVVYFHRSATLTAPAGSDATSTDTTVVTTPSTSTTDSELSESQLKDRAWDIFQQYLVAVKAHDLAAFKSLSYQVSDVCQDAKQLSDCNLRMDTAYSFGKDFKKADFTHMYSDGKQIILFTDWHVEETDLALGQARSVIYFTRTKTGTPQILSFTRPEEIVYTLKGKDDTHQALLTELIPRVKDTDQDGAADEVETCSYPNADKTCVKTDPSKRDSNGNGWWDGIESLFYTATKTTN